MRDSNNDANNNSDKMERVAKELSQQLNHSNNQVIQLTSENELLRSQLEALRGGSRQTGQLASVVDQQAVGPDLDEACDVAGPLEKNARCDGQAKTLRPQQKRKYIPESESDDEEPVPVKVEGRKNKDANTSTEKAKKPGASPSVGLKRKRPFDTSRLSQSLEESTAPKKARKIAKPTPKAEPPKRERGQTTLTTLPSKKDRPPPIFKPASKSPLPRPAWLTPPSKPSSKFQHPITKPVEPGPPKQKKPDAPRNDTKKTPSATAPDVKPVYAETPPFPFKLIVSYPTEREEQTNPDATMDYHESDDLTSNMSQFWRTLKRQVEIWETRAGAEWAWELQKTQHGPRRNGRGEWKRFCVSSKVAGEATQWRAGDDGRYACENCAKCAKKGKLCFTWVKEEDEDDGGDQDDDGILSSKGEFWCLPVHPDDRRCAVKKDREIRTWLNEGSEDSGSDSSGEDMESSEEDEWKDVEDEDVELKGSEGSDAESVDDDYEYLVSEEGEDEGDL